MLKLYEIKLAEAKKQDFARALNYSMRKSKETAKVFVNQLQLNGPLKVKHIDQIYPEDTFMKDGKINPVRRLDFAIELRNIFKRQKPLGEYNMLDFANAIIQKIQYGR